MLGLFLPTSCNAMRAPPKEAPWLNTGYNLHSWLTTIGLGVPWHGIEPRVAWGFEPLVLVEGKWDPGSLLKSIGYAPFLVLKGIYHYQTYLFIFFPGAQANGSKSSREAEEAHAESSVALVPSSSICQDRDASLAATGLKEPVGWASGFARNPPKSRHQMRGGSLFPGNGRVF